MAEDKRENLWSVLWIVEVAVGLLPAGIILLTGVASYLPLLMIASGLVGDRDPVFLKTFFHITVMVVGGMLGLLSIGMAFDPNRLRRSACLRMMAVAFGCAGILAEILFAQSGGGTPNLFRLWVLLGPVLVGAHCAYRVFWQHET